MAYACPACRTPESVAALFTSAGATVFPCLECRWSPPVRGVAPEQRVELPCNQPACGGTSHDGYGREAGRLRVWHGRCDACGCVRRPYEYGRARPRVGRRARA